MLVLKKKCLLLNKTINIFYEKQVKNKQKNIKNVVRMLFCDIINLGGRFMKKHGLIKILVLTIIGLLILTWIIPGSQFTGSEMAKADITRIGLFDIFNYPLLTFQYFIQMALFMIVVGGFYGVLNKTGKYNELVEKFAKKLKGKEIIFLIVTSFVLAGFSSVFGFSIVMFLFIPFLVSVILLLGYDKIVAFLVTCVSILIGVMGSTYNLYVSGYINQVLNTEYTDLIVAKIAIFVIAFVLFIMFVLKYAAKVKKSTKNSILEEQTEDVFYVKEKDKSKSKAKTWPMLVIFGIMFVLFILACVPWADVFGVKIFTTLNETITTAKIGDYTIWSFLLGEVGALGTWDFAELTQILLMASVAIALIYKIKFDDLIDNFALGCKKVLKVAVAITLAMVIVIITAYHPIFPTICNVVIGWMDSFNVVATFLTSFLAIIGSALNIEVIYLSQSVLGFFGATFTTAGPVIAVIFQAMYGLTMLVAPTSLMLILGLEYLDIPYTKWLKFSWKLILELLVILLEIFVIITLV